MDSTFTQKKQKTKAIKNILAVHKICKAFRRSAALPDTHPPPPPPLSAELAYSDAIVA